MYQHLDKPSWEDSKTWERFWSKVVLSEHGYVWIAAKTEGYGTFRYHGENTLAHRLVWYWAKGVWPDTIDHVAEVCGVRNCVTLEHLEDVTHGENAARGQRAKTHCPQGHAYTPENTYLYGPKRFRQCRTCREYQNAKRNSGG